MAPSWRPVHMLALFGSIGVSLIKPMVNRRGASRVEGRSITAATCDVEFATTFGVTSRCPHGDAADDADPVHASAGVTDELDRLTTLGAIQDDDAVGSVECDRPVRAELSGARAI